MDKSKQNVIYIITIIISGLTIALSLIMMPYGIIGVAIGSFLIFAAVYNKKSASAFEEKVTSLTSELINKDVLINELNEKLSSIGYTEYEKVKAELDKRYKEFEAKNTAEMKKAERELEARNRTIADEMKKAERELEARNKTIAECDSIIDNKNTKIAELTLLVEKLQSQVATATRKLQSVREIYKSVEYSINRLPDYNDVLSSSLSSDLDIFAPSVIIKLHCLDIKDLRKSFKENEKQISRILEQYEGRYTTKANQAIYRLMVIALRAELQNILYAIKYEKLDDGIDQVKQITAKYLVIAETGNQSIANTLTKFIGEIEYLFINAVKIEYNYYVKKEQSRQEQAAIKEQMRQENEERKALELEKKRIEAEESKYSSEIDKLKEQLLLASQAEQDALNKRILELQAQLSEVVIKKDTIATLQNGKAGNIYIISNLGSFGENVFKVGMTRRLQPQDRVDELGSASVPFKFDVHSFIFSQDAVELENVLHNKLHDHRVNKVNLRKEFFNVNIDELEELVNEIEPTAEFNKTMAAEEYRQSLSTDSVYSCVTAQGEYDNED